MQVSRGLTSLAKEKWATGIRWPTSKGARGKRRTCGRRLRETYSPPPHAQHMANAEKSSSSYKPHSSG